MIKNNSLILALGLIISSTILSWGFTRIKTNNNYVTVKGLSEREVVADKAWLSINTQITANTTDEMQSNIARVESEIKKFLEKNGFSGNEINSPSINVYQNNYQGATSRLNGDYKLSVSTDDISKIKKTVKLYGDLIAKGILIQSDQWSAGPKYYYTRFKELKKDMLAEATQEAKAAAQEFATNSGSTVGKIRRANQGVFQILPKNQTQDSEVFSDEKIVRVVSTVDYYLE